MKKSRFLVATLTAATFAIGCAALVACGDNDSGNKPNNNGGDVYEITFNANGGEYAGGATTTKLTTGEDGRIASKPADPTREGDWRFLGYNVSADGSGVTISFGSNGYQFTANITVFAQWGEPTEEYEITLNAGEGTLSTSKVTTVNGKIGNLPEPTPPAKKLFVGWFTAAIGGTEITSNTLFTESGTIYAQYEDILDPIATEYTVTFDATGGTLPEGTDRTVTTKDVKLESLPTPIRTEQGKVYRFLGWYTTPETGGNHITTSFPFTGTEHEITIYARWQEEYVVTFVVGENGTMPEGVGTTMTTVDGKLQLTALPWPTPADGYRYIAWYTEEDGQGERITIDTVYTANTTIYAYFDQSTEEYTINFNAGEGTLPTGAATSATTVKGKLESLPTPTPPENHRFVGWYTAVEGGDPVTTNYTFTEGDDGRTIYARYVEEFTVTFDANGGTLDGTATMTTENGKLQLEAMPEPTREGCLFGGWYDESEERIGIDKVYTQNTTLVAKWKYAITLNVGDGTYTGETTVETTIDGVIPILPTPTAPANCTFDGWYTAATGGTKITTTTVLSAGATIYARYTRKDGVWVGNNYYALSVNPGSTTRTEYWLGGSKITLNKDDVINIYIGGQLIEFYIESSSAGIDKSNTSKQVTSVTVTVTGEFAIYLHKNSDDWSCEFAGQNELGDVVRIPSSAKGVNLNFKNGTVTLYIKSKSNDSWLDPENFYIYMWEGGHDAGNYPGIKITNNMSLVGDIDSKYYFILSMGGDPTKTANLQGLQVGGTFVVEYEVNGSTVSPGVVG